MSETTPRAIRYVYRARGATRDAAVYLVEWHPDSRVVATVEPVYPSASSNGVAVARGAKVVVRGPWETTPSRRHHRARVADAG